MIYGMILSLVFTILIEVNALPIIRGEQYTKLKLVAHSFLVAFAQFTGAIWCNGTLSNYLCGLLLLTTVINSLMLNCYAQLGMNKRCVYVAYVTVIILINGMSNIQL